VRRISGQLGRRLAVTVAVLAAFRVGSHILSPALSAGFRATSPEGYGGILQIQGVQAYSFFGLGVVPYVAAVLLFTLVGRSVPFLGRLRNGGPAEAARYQSLMRLLTLVLGAMTSLSSIRGADNQLPDEVSVLGAGSWGIATHVLFQLAGLLVLLALAELVTRFGLGNGVSVVLVAAVLSGIAPSVSAMSDWTTLTVVLFASASVISVVAIALATRLRRELDLFPIHPQAGSRGTGVMTFRATSGGAGPMLFAGSVMVAASGFSRLLPLPEDFSKSLKTLLDGSSTSSLLLLTVLTVIFARVYVNVSADPVETANKLTASGRFLRGKAPGLPTTRTVARVNNASGWLYAAALLPIAGWPVLLQSVSDVTVPYAISGSAVVIPVLVVTEILIGTLRRRA
jgi:preprotein translocase subunit SecY